MDINKALFKFIKIGFTIMIILFVLLATVYLSRTGYDYGYRLFTETAVDEAPGTDILVQIKQGNIELAGWQAVGTKRPGKRWKTFLPAA